MRSFIRKSSRSSYWSFLLLVVTYVTVLLIPSSRRIVVRAAADDDAAANNNNNNAAGDGDDYYSNVGNGDDYSSWNGNDDAKFYASKGDDYIKYWTEYALLPKRCVEYNGIDVIIFSVYENRYKQCSDDAVGTYYNTVPAFFSGYMKQKYQDAIDQGNEYYEPDVIQYAYCVGYFIQNVMYYLQVGCTDGTTQGISINIYSDKECTIKSKTIDGYDDAMFDTSEIQINFKKCHNCVNWFDMDEDVDDGFYEKRMTEAPMCSTAWESKQTCDRKCQHIGLEKHRTEGWNTSDQLLLLILSAFGLIMLGLIIRKRIKMSNKDALLEQAAMSAAGLQQPHVIGIFILIVLVIAVFALLGLKNITWALMLLINTALFAYLMKLTVDSSVNGVGESIIGPDGTIIIRQDHDSFDDDSSTEDNNTTNNNCNGGGASTVGASSTKHFPETPSTLAEQIENRASATSYVLPTIL